MECKMQNLNSYLKVELEKIKLKNIGFKTIVLLEKKGGVKSIWFLIVFSINISLIYTLTWFKSKSDRWYAKIAQRATKINTYA